MGLRANEEGQGVREVGGWLRPPLSGLWRLPSVGQRPSLLGCPGHEEEPRTAPVLPILGGQGFTPPPCSTQYLVSGRRAAPTLVPRDGSLGLSSNHTVQIQGLSFHHCGG
jgi:hypothetical protein